MLTKIEFIGIDVEPITFDLGVNLILSDKDSQKESNNSVGKTLLIDSIDLIYASDKIDKFEKYVELRDVSVRGFLRFGEEFMTIERKLVPLSDQEKKDKGLKDINVVACSSAIEKRVASNQISLIDYRKILKDYYCGDGDLSFRHYNSMFFKKDTILKDFKNAIKSHPSDSFWKMSVFQSYFLGFDSKKFKEFQPLTTKEKSTIKKVSPALEKSISDDLDAFKKIETLSNENQSMFNEMQEYYFQNRKMKTRQSLLKNNLKQIDELVTTSFSSIYNVFRDELGDLLIRNFEESESFHNELLRENKSLNSGELREIEYKILSNESEITRLRAETNEIAEKVQKLESSGDNQASKYLLAKIMTGGEVNEIVNSIDKTLKVNHLSNIQEYLDNEIVSANISSYRTDLTEMVNSVYQDLDEIVFEIKADENANLDIQFSFDGSDGEGKGTIRTLIYYFLLHKINVGKNNDYMIFDSPVFDSVDSDDLERYLSLLDSYGKKGSSQFIIAGRSQNFTNTEKFRISRKLTPKSPLFGVEFKVNSKND